MTRPALERAVATALGESLATVRNMGFGLLHATRSRPDLDAIRLALDCPFCGHAVDHPGSTHTGSSPLAECHRCDIDFEFAESEVYVTSKNVAERAA